MSFLEFFYSESPVSVQTFLLNMKALELYYERYGKKFWKLYREFDENQWLSRDHLEEMQSTRLRKLVKHAYETVPYYHKIFKKRNIDVDSIQSIDDLFKIPILTKEDIRKNYNELISTAIPRRKIRYGHTSGTTGSPLNVAYDIATCVAHHAADWRQKSWAGLEYGQPYASLQGRVIVPVKQKNPPFWRKNYFNNQLFLSAFHLSEKNLPFYFDKLESDSIKFLEGYPSNLYILALYLNKKKLTFPLSAVLTSSETLWSYQKDAIEKAFCCKIFDYYGMAERTVFATECDHHSGHHLNLDYGITEFLDSNYCPVKAGKMGTLVATSLFNYAMPMIRYQTNDSCSLKDKPCACGRGFPLMDAVATKNEAIVTLPDGRLISPSVLTHPFKPMVNIVESQIIQKEPDKLCIKIVRSDSYTELDEQKLLAGFAERLGAQVRVEVEYVHKISRTKSGKFKWVISHVNPHF